MTSVLSSFRGTWAYSAYKSTSDWLRWTKNGFMAPAPRRVKQDCLMRNGYVGAIWVETGTYLGQTAAFLAKRAATVYTIEPSPALFEDAKRRLRKYPNVRLLCGTSEEVLPTLLPELSGNINFWLDGHASGGVTFRGAQESPILDELSFISRFRRCFDNVAVMVDDVRCFGKDSGYPELGKLVDWAQHNEMMWTIEHDIFVAKSTRE